MKAYKFRLNPNKEQARQLDHHLWMEKNLWNEMLAFTKESYANYEKFATKKTLRSFVKESGLYSQAAQELVDRLDGAIWRMIDLRKKGIECGFPRFKSFDRMKSLSYPQSGFSLGKKLKVTPFGEMDIVQHRDIIGTIKTLVIKKDASGKWFACITVDEPEVVKASNGKPRVGIDLGLKTLATISDGKTIKNPRHIKKHAKKLAKLQRNASRKKKGSNNRWKANKLAAVEYEHLKNARKDFLHKETRKLVNSYSFIALEDLSSQEMAEQRFGKSINDAGWGMFASMMRNKAESAGCEVVFVNPKDTTKTCNCCGSKQDMPLEIRTYVCHSCGHTEDRDLNAAKNILARATEGHSENYACGNLISTPSKLMEQVISMKQEAHTL